MPDAGHSFTPPDLPAALRRERLHHWLWVAAAGLYCHGLLLTNDGVYWDGWWLRGWLMTGNWEVLHEFCNSAGMPLATYVNWAFAWLSDPVPGMMFATVALLTLSAGLVYESARQSGWFTAEEALAVALLSLAFPVCQADQDIVMVFVRFTQTLFYASVLAAVRAMDAPGWHGWAWRMTALAGLFTAGANAGLLAFQGVSFAFLCACWHQRHPSGTWWRGVMRFTIRHLDFLFLPFATWWFRITFTPQFGAYANYNRPQLDWFDWRSSFRQYMQAVGTHFSAAGEWLANQPGWLLLVVLGLIAWLRFSPARGQLARGPAQIGWLVSGGMLGLLLGILPYVAAGKALGPTGLGSRSGLLLALPVGLLLFVAIRLLAGCSLDRIRGLAWPMIWLSVLLLGREYSAAYLAERVEWVQARALQELLADQPEVRSASYVRVCGVNTVVAMQEPYLNYGMEVLLGSPLTRFFSPQATHPTQLERSMIRRGGMLPRDFIQIDPAGREVTVDCWLAPVQDDPIVMVARYHHTQWWGAAGEWERLRRQLARVECRVTREAMPLEPSATFVRQTTVVAAAGMFTNSVEMRMVQQPGGRWAGQFEVTQAEYEAVMAGNPSRFRDAGRPVECVSWHEAQEFCRRLTRRESTSGQLPSGLVYSLPTEAMWDAMELGTRTADGVFNPDYQRWHTAPVGTCAANPQGLHDLRGNVWEWCLDWADSARHARVLKGECWLTPRSSQTTLAGRQGMRPDQAFWHTGFRCVLVPEASLPPQFRSR